MDFDSLNIRDFATAAPFFAAVARVERLAGRWKEREYGSGTAPELIARSTAAAMRLGGWSGAEARGYGDVLRLVMEHGAELPFAESQVKYFHSLVLRHDPSAAALRRRYRDPGVPAKSAREWGLGEAPDGAAAGAAAGRLVRETAEALASGEAHPLVAIALFLHRFLVCRPFADGNGRLALALAVYLLVTYGYDHVRRIPIEELLEERRDACAESLARATEGDAAAWALFFVDMVADSLEQALGAAGRGAEGPRLHPRQARVLDALRERGAAKIGDLIEPLGVPRATLKKDLKRLVDAGLLSTRGVRKGTVYHVEPRRR